MGKALFLKKTKAAALDSLLSWSVSKVLPLPYCMYKILEHAKLMDSPSVYYVKWSRLTSLQCFKLSKVLEREFVCPLSLRVDMQSKNMSKLCILFVNVYVRLQANFSSLAMFHDKQGAKKNAKSFFLLFSFCASQKEKKFFSRRFFVQVVCRRWKVLRRRRSFVSYRLSMHKMTSVWERLYIAQGRRKGKFDKTKGFFFLWLFFRTHSPSK